MSALDPLQQVKNKLTVFILFVKVFSEVTFGQNLDHNDTFLLLGNPF